MSKRLTQPGKHRQAALLTLLLGFFFHGIFSSLLLKYQGCSTIFRVLDITLIMLAISFLVLQPAKITLGLFAKKLRSDKGVFWLIILLAVFVGWCIIRAFQTNLPLTELAIVLLADFSLFWAILAGVLATNGIKKADLLIMLSSLVGIVSLVAIGFYAFGLHDNIDRWLGYGRCGTSEVLKVGGDSGWLRSRGFVRNPNELGALLVIPSLILIHAWLMSSRKRSKQYLLPLLGTLSLLLLTFSRSAWLGLVVAGLTLLIIDRDFRRSILSRPLLIGFVLAAMAIASFGISRSNTLINGLFLHKGAQSNSTAQHIDAKREGLDEIAENPLGRGPATTGVVGLTLNETKYTESESAYFDTGIAYGWVGLVLLLCLITIVCFLLYQAAAWPVLAGFIGIATAGLVIPVWSNLTVTLFTGLLVGLSLSKKARN